MMALSIRQPWAWLIVNGHKDVENRTWPTQFRGRFLVHAGKTMTRREYEVIQLAIIFGQAIGIAGIRLPRMQDLLLGGIIGEVELVDCSRSCMSPWHTPGQWGFVLKNARVLPFSACKGRLGFFGVDWWTDCPDRTDEASAKE